MVGRDAVHERHLPANLPRSRPEPGPGPAVAAGDVSDAIPVADAIPVLVSITVFERFSLALNPGAGSAPDRRQAVPLDVVAATDRRPVELSMHQEQSS